MNLDPDTKSHPAQADYLQTSKQTCLCRVVILSDNGLTPTGAFRYNSVQFYLFILYF